MGTSVQTHQDGTFPNYTEEKPSPSRKKSMICVDTNGYLIWNHFHLRGILGLDVYVMWPEMFSYVFLIFIGLKWFTTSWNHKYSPQMLWEHHFRPVKMDHSQLYREEKPSPSRKKSMISVDTNGYLIWKHFHLRGILGLDVYVMWPDMFFLFVSSSSWVWNGLPHPETINIRLSQPSIKYVSRLLV